MRAFLCSINKVDAPVVGSVGASVRVRFDSTMKNQYETGDSASSGSNSGRGNAEIRAPSESPCEDARFHTATNRCIQRTLNDPADS